MLSKSMYYDIIIIAKEIHQVKLLFKKKEDLYEHRLYLDFWLRGFRLERF